MTLKIRNGPPLLENRVVAAHTRWRDMRSRIILRFLCHTRRQ